MLGRHYLISSSHICISWDKNLSQRSWSMKGGSALRMLGNSLRYQGTKVSIFHSVFHLLHSVSLTILWGSIFHSGHLWFWIVLNKERERWLKYWWDGEKEGSLTWLPRTDIYCSGLRSHPVQWEGHGDKPDWTIKSGNRVIRFFSEMLRRQWLQTLFVVYREDMDFWKRLSNMSKIT